MKITHTQKFIRMSPRKLRLVAGLARKMSPQEAIEKLPFSGKRAAGPLVKVLKGALANAKDQNIPLESLSIKEIQIGDGPRLKRGRPVSRGRWHPYQRKMSHIRITLEAEDSKIVKKAEEKKGKGSGKPKTKVLEKPELLKEKKVTGENEQKDKGKVKKSGILGRLAGKEKGGAKSRQVQERGG